MEKGRESMDNENLPVSDLFRLINGKIADWKRRVRVEFKKKYPQSDKSDFERAWPETLKHLLLIETSLTTQLIRHRSENWEKEN